MENLIKKDVIDSIIEADNKLVKIEYRIKTLNKQIDKGIEALKQLKEQLDKLG